MDWIVSYGSPKWRGKSRASPDVFVKALGEFYDEYTDTKLEKVEFSYYPKRFSEGVKWTPEEESLVGWKPCPPETDEEVDKTFEYMKRLNVIDEYHCEKTPELYEYHKYEIAISSFIELYALLKTKTNISSSYDITLQNEFNFNDYDYSELEAAIPYYANKAKNRIWVFGGNGVEFGRQPNKKFKIGTSAFLFFPVFTEKERNFLKYMEKTLKIKFSSRGFNFYYKTDKGKVRSKGRKTIL